MKPEKAIMKLDDQTDLLAKAFPIGNVESHPVPFPLHQSFLVHREVLAEKVRERIEAYPDRDFRVAFDNHGLEASINYDEGEFESLILKGSGDEGERVLDSAARRIVPHLTALRKEKITVHVLLTVKDPKAYDAAKQVREALRTGNAEHVAIRVLRVYVKGVRFNSDKVFSAVGLMTTAYEYLAVHSQVEEWALSLVNEDAGEYSLPVRGVIISDEYPDKEQAFPETRFLLV